MKVVVNNIEVDYCDTGSGPPVILLHGWGSDKGNLAQLQQALKANFRVITLDLPGFGTTPRPTSDWTIEDYANFLGSFLRQLNVTKVHAFVAHSFGGRICIKGIATNVLASDKLVLIGSAGIRHSKSIRNYSYMLIAKIGKLIMKLPGLSGRYETARKRLHEQAGAQDYDSANDMRAIFLNAINEDLSQLAQSLRVDTLLIWGSDDSETPLSDARFLHNAISGSSLRIIQGAGHFVHNEFPDKVAKWITDFLV